MTRRSGEYWDTAPSPASAAPPSAQPRPLGPEMGPGGQVRQIQGGAHRESLPADAVVRPLRWCSDNQIRTPPHLLPANVPRKGRAGPHGLRAAGTRTGPSLTQFGDPSRAALRLESLTPGSLLPSLRFGVTLSSLRVRYAPFGESPRVLPRSGSSLSQPLRESERLARDGDDDTVHVKQALVCASELRRSGSSLGVGGST